MDFLRKQVSLALARLGYSAYRFPVFGNFNWLRQTETWSQKQRQEWQLSRLAKILEFAWNQVPFYREFWGDHGITFRPLRHLEEIQAYPILTKAVFRSNSHRLQPRNLSGIRHMQKATGGSTSVPVHYLLDLEQWALMEAFHLWGWGQAGYEFGDPVGVIAGGSLLPEGMTIKSRARGFVQRRLFLYGVAMDRDLARNYHAQLVRYGAEFLYGYPSILYLFAKHLAEQSLRLPKLKAVVTTAEMLLPTYRQGIEKWLGCRVFNDLGSNDGGFEAYECRYHNGLHYNDLQTILEVKAGPRDSLSQLLITNLWNRSTPFIRYENGDSIELGSSPCPCGSQFPLIARVEGRTADILTFPNGRSLSGPALTLIFGDMAIDGWQVVRTGASTLEVRILSSGEIPENYQTRILRVLSHHLGSGVDVLIKRVDQLTVTQGGKLRPVWSEFKEAEFCEHR